MQRVLVFCGPPPAVCEQVSRVLPGQEAGPGPEPGAGTAEREGGPAGASTGGGWFTSLLSPGAFYQGGFEDTMTKREAALILGVRESASRDKIRDAHRYMSRVNHPDTGGSAYLATKINEARDLMLNSK
ncbi:hypothetical protein BASA81_015612 [Batrachochytrium salamandrivorans]|nr:hypothetical protein BASA81_015612 [Batrachochytrium salamandrivorans]